MLGQVLRSVNFQVAVGVCAAMLAISIAGMFVRDETYGRPGLYAARAAKQMLQRAETLAMSGSEIQRVQGVALFEAASMLGSQNALTKYTGLDVGAMKLRIIGDGVGGVGVGVGVGGGSSTGVNVPYQQQQHQDVGFMNGGANNYGRRSTFRAMNNSIEDGADIPL